jgi:transcription factor S
MEFCKKCGSVILGKKCVSCGFVHDEEVKLETSQTMPKKKEVICIDENDNEVNPIVDFPCPKCKNPQSYFWTKQTRAGDEAETRFYKCAKCKHTWRIYR